MRKMKILTVIILSTLVSGYLNYRQARLRNLANLSNPWYPATINEFTVGPFSIFSIIRFPNTECTTSTGRTGICYTTYECERFGGAATGRCASGHGTCCLMEASCNEEAKTNLSHFISPRYPLATTDSSLCDFQVNKTSGICQLRLDMEQFELEGPVNGECDMDVFMVMGLGTNVKVPQMCGRNTGQHLYVDIQHTSGPIILRFLIGESNWGRRWSIRISTIECTSPYKPPQKCHQYFNSLKGSFKSLGYDELYSGGFQSYTNNVDYNICFEPFQPDICSIDFQPAHNDSFRISRCEAVSSFEEPIEQELDANYTTTAVTTTNVYPNAICSFCDADYLAIFGYDRVCGPYFSTKKFATKNEVISVDTSRPIIMNFKTDQGEVENGFHLEYEQKKCFS